MTGLFYVCMRVWSCIVPDATLEAEQSNPLRIFGVMAPHFCPRSRWSIYKIGSCVRLVRDQRIDVEEQLAQPKPFGIATSDGMETI